MPLLQLVDNVGKTGLVADIDPRKLPDGAWSDGLNVRFDGYTASKVSGSRTIQGSLSAAPYSLFPHTTFDGAQFFAYAGLTDVYTVNNNTHRRLTRLSNTSTVVPYSTDNTLLWTGGVLGGLLFLSNGVDLPQVQLTPTASCKLSNLPNWPTTVTTRAACIRAYRNFLVALDVTKGPIRYRQMVKWSSSAEPLTVPSTWDESLTTSDAGETSLSETNGTVIDCLPLRDINIIYKDDSVHGMQFIGGQFIFRFYQIFSNVGILAKRCVAAFEQYHLFVGNDLDVYVHDGNSIRSIAQDRWRDWLRANVDGSNYQRMFVAPNPATSEIWIFVPNGTDEYTSRVLMWNWRKDTWGLRQVDNVSSAAVGGVESSDYLTPWSAATFSWSGASQTWSEMESLPPDKRLVLASPSETRGLIETEIGSAELGAALPCYVERQGIWGMPSKINDGGRMVDLQSVKFIRRVRFRTVDPTLSNDINFMVAVQTDVGSPLVWQTTAKMTDSTAEVTVLKRGRFLNIRVETSEDIVFALHDFEIEVEPSGAYL